MRRIALLFLLLLLGSMVNARPVEMKSIPVKFKLPSKLAIDPNYQDGPQPLYQKSGSGYQITDYAGVVASVGPGLPPFISVGYNPQAQGRPGKIHQELNQLFLGGGSKASTAKLGGRDVLMSQSANGKKTLYTLTDAKGTRIVIIEGKDPLADQFLKSIQFP